MARQSGARTVCEFLITLKDGTEVTQSFMERRFPKLTPATISSALSDMTVNGGLSRMRPSEYKVRAIQLVEIHNKRGWKTIGDNPNGKAPKNNPRKKTAGTDADVLLALVEAIHAAAPVLQKYHKLAQVYDELNG